MLKLLIVRPYRYWDYRQNLMDFIGAIWQRLDTPRGVRVASVVYPPKISVYPSTHRLYPYVWRSWFALREWARTPAEWVCIADADVTPTRRDALHTLLHDIESAPDDTQIITPNYLAWINNSGYTRDTTLDFTYLGLCTWASDGLLTVRGALLPSVTRQINAFCPDMIRDFRLIEARYSATFARNYKIRCYPESTITVFYTWLSPNLWEWSALPAFVHFVGDLTRARYQVHYIYDKLTQGG